MYTEGYGDPGSQLAKDTGFHTHVTWGAMLAKQKNVMPFLTPLERAALKWIRAHIPKGSPTFDLGCGSGRFMISLRQLGYDACGMDGAAPPVELLKSAGFRVALGTLNSIPESWPSPSLVSCFEVLEHVPEPVEFLKAIHNRFPKTPLVLSVPLPVHERCHEIGGFFHAADYPPNHLTRWTRESLKLAFEKAGYRASIQKVHVTGDEIPNGLHLGLGIGRVIYSLLGQKSPARNGQNGSGASSQANLSRSENGLSQDSMSRQAVYRRLQRYALLPYVLWLRLKGKSGYSFLVIGE